MLFSLSIVDMGYDSLGFYCTLENLGFAQAPVFMSFFFSVFSLMFLSVFVSTRLAFYDSMPRFVPDEMTLHIEHSYDIQ